jgi:hypothetical protein
VCGAVLAVLEFVLQEARDEVSPKPRPWSDGKGANSFAFNKQF